mgnify:CR=1 FL=1
MASRSNSTYAWRLRLTGQKATAIAAAASRHLAVRKSVAGGRTRAEVDELAGDPELARDQRMIEQYLAVLGDRSAWPPDAEIGPYLARSLALAGRTTLWRTQRTPSV